MKQRILKLKANQRIVGHITDPEYEEYGNFIVWDFVVLTEKKVATQ